MDDGPGSEYSGPSDNDVSAGDDHQTIADLVYEAFVEEEDLLTLPFLMSIDGHSLPLHVSTWDTTGHEVIGMGAWIEPEDQTADGSFYALDEDMELVGSMWSPVQSFRF